ncbi:MAG: GGDEF domain-containing protein [Spirochaetaceae bacterium]|nr:MAG: GGDEF domain-containing protein [Spirochaetaceae bacterium]
MSDHQRHSDLTQPARKPFDPGDILSRRDVPADVKQRVHELEQSVVRLQSSLDETVEQVRQLNEAVQHKERRQNRLEKQLSYNRKSGLPNHVVMDGDIHAILEEAERSPAGSRLTVLILALDERYDTIKQTTEAGISEWLLYRTAERLREQLPTNARLYHTRDNEFVMVTVNVGALNSVTDFAHRVVQEVSRPMQFPDYSLSVGCRCGVACYPEHARSKRMLLRNADIALTTATKAQRSVVLYDNQMGQEIIEKMELQNSIIRGLEQQAISEIDKQFELHFQPLVEIDGIKSGVIDYHTVGAEALIRWKHPTRGMVAPARFIPLAEETGLIVPIGYWALFNATAELQNWLGTRLEPLFLSVNLSPRQFKDDYLIENIARVLKRHHIDPSQLRLEVTENSVMDDPDDSIRKIQAIHEMGIQISIDDFGTGYSSLNYLKRFPISTIKLDKSFIDDVQTNRNTQGIVRAILSMAASMKMKVVAEGIETYDQASYLYNQGCSCIQGYYFQRPMTLDAFRAVALSSAGVES